jgi:hypothetical protein
MYFFKKFYIKKKKILFVEEYLKIKKDNLEKKVKIEKIKEINENFIKNDSNLELNISSGVKSEFEIYMKDVNNLNDQDIDYIFDLLFESVKTNITDTYSRFVFSKFFVKSIKIFSNKLIDLTMN